MAWYCGVCTHRNQDSSLDCEKCHPECERCEELDERGYIKEAHDMVEGLELKSTIFRSNHASNYLALEGRLSLIHI